MAGFPTGDNILADTTITTPLVMLQVGQTIPLDIGLIVRAQAGVPGSAQIDFSHTLSFPTSGPVFNLPEGYTINAPDLGIFNNQFIPAEGSSVPEPSSVVLTAIALIGAGLHRRKRRDCDRE